MVRTLRETNLFRLRAIGAVAALACLVSVSSYAVPLGIVVQGKLVDASDKPLGGLRMYRVQFYDAATTGQALGAPIQNVTQISNVGRFSIEVIPPTEALAAAELYYELAIDSSVPIDNVIDPGDVFPNRVRVAGVMYAQKLARDGAGSGLNADLLDGLHSMDYMTSATAAAALANKADVSHAHSLQDLTGHITNAQIAADLSVFHAASADLATTAQFAQNAASAANAAQADYAANADFAHNAMLAGVADFATSAVHADAADTATNANHAMTADIVATALSADNATTAQYALNALNAAQADYAANADFAHNAMLAGVADYATSAVHADVADTAANVTNAIHATNADYATSAAHAAYADNATTAQALAGTLNVPGDRLQLGSNVYFVVTASGGIELVVNGQRNRLASQRWRHPVSIQDNISPDGQSAQDPQIAMDSSGDAIIVWRQSDGANTQIFKSEFRRGAWAHPCSLSDNISPDGQDAFTPQVAMDSNGAAIITWRQLDGATDQIYKSEYRNGIWSHPSSLVDHISLPGYGAYDPYAAMDGNGNAIIAWHQSGGANVQIFKSEYRAGAWTHPSSFSDNISPDGYAAFYPAVAMGNNGDAIIAWVQHNGSDYQVFKSEYRSGAWIHPSGISDNINPDGVGANRPKAAMDNNGNAIIAWHQYDGANSQIFKSEYRSGAWTHPSSLSDNISPDGQDAIWPRIAMDSNGAAIIAWSQRDGANDQVYKSEYRSGAWKHPANLADHISLSGQPATNTPVAMSPNGAAVIAWVQLDGVNYRLYKSEYRDGSWRNPASFSERISPTGDAVSLPQVAMDADGGAIIAWYQYQGAVTYIFKSEYTWGF